MRKPVFVAAAVLASLLVPVQSAEAALDPVNTQRLRNAVTVSGILGHERALQRIANRNEGTRASGTPGYLASLEYVERQLTAAGYDVNRQAFTFPFFRELEPAELSRVTPTPVQDYEVAVLTYSGSGDVTGVLVPTIDVQIPPGPTPSSSTSGCEASDFTPAPDEPAVALIQRGTCTFFDKVTNAVDAGYDAVVIFNEGQPGRTDAVAGTLGEPVGVPVVGISFADGEALYNAAVAGEVTVNVTTSTETDLDATTWNLIADSPGGDPDQTVVVGAHLDSVVEGPGINDNGSGSSTILEIAEQISRLNIVPRRQLRFAFWGAEEAGLLGSEHYVTNLSDEEVDQIYANLNFDMVGSPNYVRFVYDGNGSDTPTAGPPGSAQIESLFTDYFAAQGLASEPTAFDGRSDYGPFIAVGIPAGGLFTGAEGIKTPAQAAIYGGTAGVAYDPCYHQACDTINNLSTKALFEMGDAAAHATLTLARSRSGLYEDGSRVGSRTAAEQSFDFKGHLAVR